MQLVSLILLLFLLNRIRSLRRLTAGTSAEAARRWALAACGVCLLTAVTRVLPTSLSARTDSALQYLSAVMLLTPWIAVLGARRPGNRAWPWFVIVPMIVVLQWPSLTQLAGSKADFPVEVPTPTFAGFVLVLIMGSGNFFGTINTGAAMLTAVATLLIALPETEWAEFSRQGMFFAGCLLMTLSAVLLPGSWSQPFAPIVSDRLRKADQPDGDEQSIAGVLPLWIMFRDLFGIVWAKRVMDRVNVFAEREHWSVRLTLDGFLPVTASTDCSEGADLPACTSGTWRSAEVLCWLLRRFLDRSVLERWVTPRVLTAFDTDPHNDGPSSR
ncbi:MAG: hypothetical protein R3C49_01540 [Planctomycetaceae bacterium]